MTNVFVFTSRLAIEVLRAIGLGNLSVSTSDIVTTLSANTTIKERMCTHNLKISVDALSTRKFERMTRDKDERITGQWPVKKKRIVNHTYNMSYKGLLCSLIQVAKATNKDLGMAKVPTVVVGRG